jgi:alpha-L-fucosidase 2
MMIRITADKKASIHFTTSLTSKLRYTSKTKGKDLLVLTGKAPKQVANRPSEAIQVGYDENPNGEGMNFVVYAKVVNEGGVLHQTGDQLEVRQADAVTIYLSEATSFNGFDKSPGLAGKDPAIEAGANLQNAVKQSFAVAEKLHVADYRSLFGRVTLDLGENIKTAKLPTDERLKKFTSAPDDHGLTVLYYQFGRYLMIASTRPGSRPTNLQGIWNDAVQPPWGSNYTTNINTEMNYWLAENTNLSECHQPLFDFMKELAVNGAITAKTNYGINEGWVTHHNSDLWAKTSPPGGYDWDPKDARWSAWPMAGAWFSTHLWEHYLFTGDKKFLKEQAYPLMKGAAQFLLHWLIKDPESGLPGYQSIYFTGEYDQDQRKEYELAMAGRWICRSFVNCLRIDQNNRCAEISMPAFREQLIKQKKNYILFISEVMASCRNGSKIGMILMISTGISLIYSDCIPAAR